MAQISPRVAVALNRFLTWFEDNMCEESWLDPEDDTDGPDGTWKPYSELPEYTNLVEAIDLQKKMAAAQRGCNHVWHTNPALITPCPECGAGK